jgi:methionyl aminopeptidase
MIIIKTKEEIHHMREAGIILASCHQEVAARIKPGVTTAEIDQFVERYLLDRGATAEQKGYHGYPFATCGSVNDVICHGFPTNVPMKKGDIVTIDFVVNLNGWLADSAWSYRVGEVSKQADHLLKTTEASMYKGIEQAIVGNRLGDVSNAIQRYAEKEGYSVVRNFCGHGIGQQMHESPQVAHYGPPGKGELLRAGMVLTVEPMLNAGTYHCKIDADGWTARTVDGKLSAKYEHTIAITANGPLILTKL